MEFSPARTIILVRTTRTALLVLAWGVLATDGWTQVYEIRDTAKWDNSQIWFQQMWTSHGTLGVLYVNDVYQDSIDLLFGLRPVHGGVIYQKIRAERFEDGIIAVDPTWHVFFDGMTPTNLEQILPNYDWVLSSPSVIDSMVYYWGIDLKAGAEGPWSLSAVRYNFSTRAVESTHLYDLRPETDNRWFLDEPKLEGDSIRFGQFLVDKNLKLPRRE